MDLMEIKTKKMSKKDMCMKVSEAHLSISGLGYFLAHKHETKGKSTC